MGLDQNGLINWFTTIIEHVHGGYRKYWYAGFDSVGNMVYYSSIF